MTRFLRSPPLDALLARRPEEYRWLGPCELAGFFFALGAAPQLVPPSEWMELVFGAEGPDADSIDELNAAIEPLFELYNEAMGLAREPDHAGLPPWLAIRPEPVENVGGDAPLARWSRGFRYGHLWLEELWDVPLPEEVEQEYASALVCLSLFGLDEAIPEMLEELGSSESRLPEVARRMIDVLPDAMATYSMLGRTLEEVLSELDDPEEPDPDWSPDGIRASTLAASEDSRRPAAGEPRPGDPPRKGPIRRNDPCPCGSGRKFKRCCGRLVH